MSLPPLRNLKYFKKAFTLIELLLVVSLLSVTGLAIYHAISDGLKVWEYSCRFSMEEDVAVFFEKLSFDLQSTYLFDSIKFEGKEDEISIPTIIRTPIDKKISLSGELIEQMGVAEYTMDKTDKTLDRRQANYSQALKKKFSVKRVLAKPIEKLHFTYYIIEDGHLKAKKTIIGQIPASVLVQVDFMELTGGVRHLQKMISIPVGN